MDGVSAILNPKCRAPEVTHAGTDETRNRLRRVWFLSAVKALCLFRGPHGMGKEEPAERCKRQKNNKRGLLGLQCADAVKGWNVQSLWVGNKPSSR